MLGYMTDEQAITHLENITKRKFSDEQKKILVHRGGMNISACAGSGKTTILINLLAKRVLTGEIVDPNRILCTTYSKSGADEMGARLRELFSKLGLNYKLEIRTQHAVYLSILKKFGLNAKILDGGKRLQFIMEAGNQVLAERVQAGFEVPSISFDDYLELDRLFSFQLNNIMTVEKLVNSYTYQLDNIDMALYNDIRNKFQKLKVLKGVIDFDDMQLYMYRQLCIENNQILQNFCHYSWDEFYVDEAQDISKIQFAILQKMMKNGDRLLFIGDDDQCIYQWRGADPNIILNINGYYDIARYVLPTNYRCKSEIVERAALGIRNNAKRSAKTMIPFHKGGKVELLGIESKSNMDSYGELITNKILELVDNGERLCNIAVLARNNQSLPSVILRLIEHGIFPTFPFEARPTKLPYFADLKQLMTLPKSMYNAELGMEILMKTCGLFRHRKRFIQNFYDFQFSRGLSLDEALNFVLHEFLDFEDHYKNTDKALNIEVNLNDKIMYNLKMNCYTLSLQDKQNLRRLSDVICTGKSDEEIVHTLIKLYWSSNQFRVGKNLDSARILFGYVKFMNSCLEKHGLNSTIETLDIIERYSAGYYNVDTDKVVLSTIHSAKGKEWNNVFILADDTLVFPSEQDIDRMLGKKVPISDISDFIDEERRLHYVAMTRAKEKLFITSTVGYESPLLLEALANYKEPKDNNVAIINSNITKERLQASKAIRKMYTNLKEKDKDESGNKHEKGEESQN